jgi:hypothetical protein
MAAGKSTKLSVGSRIKIKAGTPLPEFESVQASGWTGMVVEAKGKGEDAKLIIEWDDQTVEKFPDEYNRYCEEKGLYSRMACFMANEVEAA